MTALSWDTVGERVYETGVDHGVLYIPNAGVYDNGVAWNGLTTVTESPTGADASAKYADNTKYLNLVALEEFGGTIEAFTYPDEFALCDGTANPTPGVHIGQQTRKLFGLSYRTQIGNDVDGNDYGYKLHLVYGCLASPSDKAYSTINDSPDAIAFSWTFTTTPVLVSGLKPTSIITVDSTVVESGDLTVLETALYGSVGTAPRLPLPDEVIGMFSLARTLVHPTTPTFVAGTGVITIPSVTGVTYRRADTNAIVTGTTTIATSGSTLLITAAPTSGAYYFGPMDDTDWSFTRS